MTSDCCLDFTDDSGLEMTRNVSVESSWGGGELSLNHNFLPINYTMRTILIHLNYNNEKRNNPKLYFFLDISNI